ncbi:DUF4190 domain-containing protein [Actinoplanes sp. NPDC023801]|uniref:DUF4190 domain-containing protein n=1 Tax=Actinoplanes sp. NPDC023801 TaxID=3154595 RepID=UPI0033F561B2
MHNQVPPDPVPPAPGFPPPAYTPPPPPFSGAPQSYPPPYGPPGWQPPPREAGTNGLAIASLLCGVLGVCAPLGLGFGIVALKQIKRRPQRGRGLAIAGIALSGLTLLFAVAVLAAAIFSDSSGPRTGSVETYRLEAGQCIRALGSGSEVSTLPVVDCARPHEAEVYHVFMMPAGPYPGEGAILDESEQRCAAALKPYLTPGNEDLELSYLYPQRLNWERQDRGVTCLAIDPKGTRTTSIMK